MKIRIPILPTLIVLIAVGIMIRLGFWQLDRMHQKEAVLTRYAAATASSGAVRWTSQVPRNEPAANTAPDGTLYRRSGLVCGAVAGVQSVSGQNARGESGYAHVADCVLADGSHARVVLGWSRDPRAPAWRGGAVTGWIAPGPRLVADPPLAGLQPNAKPDPRDIPNNHLAYAVQWFAFAAAALVIYVLALKTRLGR